MPEREVVMGSIQYVGADGRKRFASAGDKVDVHKDDVKRFDEFNVLLGDEKAAEEPVVEPEPGPTEKQEAPKPGRPRKATG